MNTYGNPDEVAFRVGPSCHGTRFKHLQIVVANTVLTDEPNTYVPGFLGGIIPATRGFEARLNWLEHEKIINRFDNLTDAHNSLLHGILSETLQHDDRFSLADSLRIFDYGCPETDGFDALLLPFLGDLYITFEIFPKLRTDRETRTCVNGVRIDHFELILTQRATIAELTGW